MGLNFTRLPSRPQTRELMERFLGYDRRLGAPEGSFVQMQNLSSDRFPMLSPRKVRNTINLPTVGSFDGVTVVDGELYYCMRGCLYPGIGQKRIDMGLSEEPKQMIRMGAYLLIFPDKKYINTVDHDDWGDIEAEYKTKDSVRFWICRPDGESYTTEWVTDTEPEAPRDKAVWINTSEYPNTIQQWNEAAKRWVKITAPCVKIFSMGIGKCFKAGDGITISGIKAAESIADEKTNAEITTQQRQQLEALEGSAVILDCGEDEIVISGVLDAHCVIPTIITVKRSLPVMDFIVEHGNRLWGCRYGLDAAGEFVNTLYASKLGDFRNWTVYQGIDTDSYYANVGTDGPFTGAISWGYADRVLFFKEHGFHSVSGGGPSTFRVDWNGCEGVQKGSGKSLCELDGAIYYKSRVGVCTLSGALPQQIGEVFDGARYTEAVGGRWRHKYYIAMKDTDGQMHLFVYDSRQNIWHREDNFKAAGILDGGTELYLLSQAGSLHVVGGSIGTKEPAVNWIAQTGKLGTDHPDRKYLTRINVRVRLDRGSRFGMFIRYDSAGGWVQLCNMASSALRAYDFPVRIRRCDHYELRFEGVGHGEIYSIVKTYQTGSDRK